MKKYILLLVLILLNIGCSKNETPSSSEAQSDPAVAGSPTFIADIDNLSTRTLLNENVEIFWAEGDEISVFHPKGFNRRYRFDGKTGESQGTFSSIVTDQQNKNCGISANYAVYPYNKDVTITDEGLISLSLPSVQQYSPSSFGQDANTMVAVTKSKEDEYLSFKNICGYLKIRLYGDINVKYLQLKGNDLESIAGRAAVSVVYGSAPELTLSNDNELSITIDCGNGVHLGQTEDEATEFWFVVPPTDFKAGFTITLIGTDGAECYLKTSKPLSIERNAVLTMTSAMAEFSIPPKNEIWYTTHNEAIIDNLDVDSWSGIVSHTYENGKGVISFSHDHIDIPSYAFHNNHNLASIAMSTGVCQIGNNAFEGCSNILAINIPNTDCVVFSGAFRCCGGRLSVNCDIIEDEMFKEADFHEIIIGDNVKEIHDEAFSGCANVKKIYIPHNVMNIEEDAFRGCSGELHVDCNIPYRAFRGASFNTVVLGEHVAEIGAESFSDCPMESINIHNNIRNIGESAFSGCRNLSGIIVFPNEVKNVAQRTFFQCENITKIILPENLTQIANEAFAGCYSLTEVNIPASVIDIGEYAFAYCSSLSGEIVLPMNLNKINCGVFCGCSKVSSFVLPGNLNEIGDSAFNGCSSFSNNIILPSSVITIGENAFANCASLAGISIPRNVERIGTYAFKDCSGELTVECEIPDGLNSRGVFAHSLFSKVTIGDEVQRIGINAFYESKEIIETTIGSSVTEIGDWAFKGCGGKLNIRCNIPDNGLFSLYDETKFSDIVICEGVTRIGDSAFENDKNIVSVTLPSTITEIGAYAFYKCSGKLTVNCNIPDASHDSWGAFYGAYFTEIHLEENVSKIGSYAFKECRFTEIELPEGLKEIGAYAFGGCRLTKLSLPDSVIELGEGAFSGCYELSCNINIPQNVTIIHDRLFEDSNICGVNIPDGVTEIGYAAFMGTMLRTITIPASVKKLGYMSLYSDLDSVTFLGTIPPEIDEMSFDTCVDVYVPAAALEIYKSAWPGYNGYDDRIYPM